MPNSVFVNELPVGRDSEDQALVGFIEEKNLHLASLGNAVMSVDSYEVLTCKPKPCKSGKQLEICQSNLATAEANLTRCEDDVNSSKKEIESLEDLNKNFKNNLRECQTNSQKCESDKEVQVQIRLQAIQKQLNEAKDEILKLEAENKAKNVKILQLENEVKDCNVIIPDCPTSQPYPRTTSRPSTENTGDDFNACMTYIDDEENRQYSKIVKIRDAANNFILNSGNVTPKPFN